MEDQHNTQNPENPPEGDAKAAKSAALKAKIAGIKEKIKAKQKLLLMVGAILSLLGTAAGTFIILKSEPEPAPPDAHNALKGKAHGGQEEHGEKKTEFHEQNAQEVEMDRSVEKVLLELLLQHHQYLKGASLQGLLSKEALKEAEIGKMLGQVLIGAGQSKTALAYLENAQKLAPNDPETKALTLLAKLKSGESAALNELRSLQAQNADDEALQEIFGEALLSVGANQEILLQSKSWKRNGSNMGILARAQMNLGGCEAALGLLRSNTAEFPKEQRSWAMLGYCLHQNRDATGADHAYKWAVGLNEEDYNTWYNLGELHYNLANASMNTQEIREHNREALEALLESVKYNSEHAEAHFRIGTLMLYNKQYRESIQHFDKGKHAPDRKLKSFLNQSLAWKNLGDLDKAKLSLDSARTIAPKDAEVWNQINEIDERPHSATPAKTQTKPAQHEPMTEHKASH